MDRGARFGATENYNTLFRNCSSVVFEGFDAVVSQKTVGLHTYAPAFSSLLTISPARAHLALKSRGLLARTLEWKDFPQN